MYYALLFVLLTFSGALLHRGIQRKNNATMLVGLLGAAATVSFFWLIGFLGEKLFLEAGKSLEALQQLSSQSTPAQ